ncbi:MAG TPA: DUF2155 domain-containing protein, partial [Alphaproteobacteria bacterium]|nr:DUF2155 domain-containing protein [Alphaproteobacteria bacterium]
AGALILGLCVPLAGMPAALAADGAAETTSQAPPQDQAEPQPTAVVLRGLDKITARITTFEAPIDQEVSFGTLRITARTCHKAPPEEPPEVAAFLAIREVRPGDPAPTELFTGWMFASSPALSALEHPVYDVWVIDCKSRSGEGSSPPSRKSAE